MNNFTVSSEINSSTEVPVQSLILKQLNSDNLNHNITHDFVLSITICLSLFLLFLILFFVCLCYNDVRWQGCLRRNKDDVSSQIRKSVQRKKSTVIEPSVKLRRKRSTIIDPSVKRTKRSTMIEQSVKRKSKRSTIIDASEKRKSHKMSRKVPSGDKSIIRRDPSKKQALSLKIPPQRHTVYEFCNFEAGSEPVSAIWTIEGDREMKTRSLMMSRQENFRISRSISYKDPTEKATGLDRGISTPDGRTFRRASSIEGMESFHGRLNSHGRRASSFEHREMQKLWKGVKDSISESIGSMDSLNSVEYGDLASASSGEFDYRVTFSEDDEGNAKDRERKTSQISIVVTNEEDGVSQVIHAHHNSGHSTSSDEKFSVVVTRSDAGLNKSPHSPKTISLKEVVVDNKKDKTNVMEMNFGTPMQGGLQRNPVLAISPSRKRSTSQSPNIRINRREPIIEESADEEDCSEPTTQL